MVATARSPTYMKNHWGNVNCQLFLYKDREAKKEKLMSPTGGNVADASATEGLSNGVKNGASKTTPNAPATPKTTPDYAASLGKFLNISF